MILNKSKGVKWGKDRYHLRMSDISKRIKEARLLSGLTQTALAKEVGVTPQGISSWERGATKPKGNLLFQLSKVLKVREEWLLFGKGESKEIKVVDEAACKAVFFVPFYEGIEVAAGDGFINSDSNSRKYAIPIDVMCKQPNKNEIFCVVCRGDSMEPVLQHGSILAVNPAQTEIIDGGVYVIRCGQSLRVKMLRETHNGFLLKSYNQDYDDEVILWQDTNDFKIIGKVFWYSSFLNS